MKVLFSLIIIFTLLVTFSAIPQDVFAETFTIKPVSGSEAPGCENNGCYSPSIITISTGDSIRFINTDNTAHTITSGSVSVSSVDSVVSITGDFNSDLVMPSTDFSFTLSHSGTYGYFCMVHPWMTGIIIVKDSGSSSTYTPPTPSYTPPTSSGTDWQGKYLKVLSDFKDISVELQRENNDLKQQIRDLENTIDDLNASLMEQVKVIYDWVLSK